MTPRTRLFLSAQLSRMALVALIVLPTACGDSEGEAPKDTKPDGGVTADGALTEGVTDQDVAGQDVADGCDDIDCDDGDPCTDDVCISGDCKQINNKAPCDDGDPCTGGDACAGGSCKSGSKNTCVDTSSDGGVKDSGGGGFCSQAGVRCPAEGELVITEIMSDPKAVSDTTGEWFEVTNLTDETIDLTGVVVLGKYIESTGSWDMDHTIGELQIDPYQALVFFRSKDVSLNGGVDAVGYEYAGVFLTGTDTLGLMNQDGAVIDVVSWSSDSGWPVVAGYSMALSGDLFDAALNDAPSAWCVGQDTLAGGDHGSPGVLNAACPPCGNGVTDDGEDCDDGNIVGGDGCSAVCSGEAMPGDLVITELMSNPKAVGDTVGEWLELYNAATPTLLLDGLVLEIGSKKHTIAPASGHVVVPGGTYVVLARNASVTDNGGIEVAYSYGGIALANSTTTVRLSHPLYGVIDEVTYGDKEAGWPPVPDGKSLQLSAEVLDAATNDGGAWWCGAYSPYGAGDLGTPGSANEVCITDDDGDLVDDGIDNCPGVKNPIQSNGDDDQWGDACDICPSVTDPDQADFDKDGLGDACDNCPEVSNKGQANNDADKWGNACDNCPNNGNDDQQDTDQNGVGDVCQPPPPVVCGDGEVGKGEACDDGGKVNGDGCSATCKKESIPSPTDIVITEIMVNPGLTKDPDGEWVELYNPTTVDIDLNGWLLRVNDKDVPLDTGSKPLVIGAGKYVVLAREATPSLNGGLEAELAPTGLSLPNSGTLTVAVVHKVAGVIDSVTIGTVGWFAPPDGVALQLAVDKYDATANDDPGSWCLSAKAYGVGDHGTPHGINHACNPDGDGDGIFDGLDNCLMVANPTQKDTDGDGLGNACETNICGNSELEDGEQCDDGNVMPGDGCTPDCEIGKVWPPFFADGLVITEFMPNPATVTDAVGEWVELYNPATTDIDIRGYTLMVNNKAVALADGVTPVIVPGGGYAVLGHKADPGVNGGLTVVDALDGLSLSNSATVTLAIVHPNGITVDQVTYNEPGWPAATSGRSLQVDLAAHATAANDDGGVWCYGGAAYGAGDFGTPGLANVACQPDDDGDHLPNAFDNCPAVPNLNQADGDGNGIGDACDAPPAPECGNNKLEDGEQCDDGNKEDGDGCSAACVTESKCAVLAVGDLIVTEIMARSQSGGADNGEWFEVHNTTDETIELSGCTTIKYKTLTHDIDGGGQSVPIAGKGYLVIGRSKDEAVNHGTPVDYVQTKITLSNSGGDLRIWSAGAEIDAFVYPSSKVSLGVSMQVSADKANTIDNSEAANWCLSVADYGDGMKGTPGAMNADCD